VHGRAAERSAAGGEPLLRHVALAHGECCRMRVWVTYVAVFMLWLASVGTARKSWGDETHVHPSKT
jgi:hypothetical protein